MAEDKAKQEAKAARESAKQVTMEEKNTQKATTEVKKLRPPVALIPLFSWLSIITLLIGVILGAGVGFGYWKMSSSSPLVSSDIYVKVVAPPGASITAARDIDSRGQYYVAQVNSLSFYQYLADELNKLAPERHYTLSELSRMLDVSYFTQVITLKVTTTTAKETEFLITSVPKYFESYLLAEENKTQQQARQGILKSIEAVEAELLKAEQDLRTLQLKQVASDVQNNPTYVALSAKIKALELELDSQATQLSTGIAQRGDSATQQQEYENTLQQIQAVNAASANVTRELQALEQKRGDTGQDEASITLDSMIKALQAEIDKLMTGYTLVSGATQTQVPGLAEMISQGITSGPEYTLALQRIKAASVAMAEAQKKKALLVPRTSATGNFTDTDAMNYQLAQIKINALNQQMASLTVKLGQLTSDSAIDESQPGTLSAFERLSAALVQARKDKAALESQGTDNFSRNELQYQFAKYKVDGLTNELATLNSKLSSSLSNSSDTSSIMDWLIVGKPSAPVLETSMKLSTTLVIGIFLGVCIAWLILNFKWLTKSIFKSFKAEEEDGTQA